MSQSYPEAQVIGIDLTPPQVFTSQPSNLSLLEADAEKAWEFDQTFDFIHGRMLTSGIHDWPTLLQRCWDHLRPEGWLELLDVCHPFRAEDSSADNETSAFIKWGHQAEKCWAINGLDYRASAHHFARLQHLSFADVGEVEVKWPLGGWSEFDHERRIGELMLKNFNAFLHKAGELILSQDPNLSMQQRKDLSASAQQDLNENCCAKRFFLTV